jgi:O-antigen ligase
MASTVTTTNLSAVLSPRQWLALALAGVCALVVGLAIGEARWIWLGVIVASFLVFRWPVETALGSFVLLVPFDSLAVADRGSGRTLLWFVGLGAACTLLVTAVVKSRLQRPPRAALWWTLFVLWCLLTSLWAAAPQDAWLAVPTAVASLVLYLASVSFRLEEKEYKRIVWLTILGGCAAALYTCREFYQGTSFHDGVDTMRGSLILGSTAMNPNVLAIRLLLPLALAIAAYFAARSRILKLICLSMSGILILGLLVTMSRGGFLAMLVMAAVFAFRLGVNRRTLLVGATIAGIILAMPSLFFTRLTEAAATGGAGRLDIWLVGWQLVKHYGLVGAGLNNFPAVYSLYAGYAPQFRGFARDPHNVYLRVIVEFGIIGVALFLKAVVVDLWRKPTSRAPGSTPGNLWLVGCEAAAWSILTFAVFGNLLWEKSFWLIWIMLAFASQLHGTSSKKDTPLKPVESPRRRPLWSETLTR